MIDPNSNQYGTLFPYSGENLETLRRKAKELNRRFSFVPRFGIQFIKESGDTSVSFMDCAAEIIF